MKEIFEDNFNDEIDSEGLVLVDFYASWCAPCRSMIPVLESLEKLHPEWKFFKFKIDDSDNVVNQYGIKSVPTFMFFKNGSAKESIVGSVRGSEIEDMMNKIANN